MSETVSAFSGCEAIITDQDGNRFAPMSFNWHSKCAHKNEGDIMSIGVLLMSTGCVDLLRKATRLRVEFCNEHGARYELFEGEIMKRSSHTSFNIDDRTITVNFVFHF